MNVKLLLVAAFFTLITIPLNALEISHQQLIEDPDILSVKLSPNGKQLGLLRDINKVRELLIINSESLKADNQITFPDNSLMTDFVWANNNRVIISLQTNYRQSNTYQKLSEQEKKLLKSKKARIYKAKDKFKERTTHELYAIDSDGKNGMFIFGKRAVQKKGKEWFEVSKEKRLTHERKPSFVLANLLDKNTVIVKTHRKDLTSIYKINFNDGLLQRLVDLPFYSNDVFYNEKDNYLLAIQRSNNKSSLSLHNLEKNTSKTFEHSFSEKLSIENYQQKSGLIWLKDYCGKLTIGFCTLNVQTTELFPVFHERNFGLKSLITDSVGNPLAYSFDDEYPNLKVLTNSDPNSSYINLIANSFKGFDANIEWSQSPHKALISINGDKQAPTWFIFNAIKEKPLSYISHQFKSLNSETYNPTYSFLINTEDDVSVQGYITLPNSNTETKPPAIVLFNDKIYDKRFTWGFNAERQFFSANGYAVVEVNHRGTGGFTQMFERLGKPNYRNAIQYDVIDAVNYLIKKNKIDGNRVCALGFKFGAKSALKSALLDKRLFRCVIIDSGLYNHYDNEEKNEHSLINRVAELKTIPMVIYGKKGKKHIEYQQAKWLMDALEKNNKNYTEFERDKDDFYLNEESHRIEYYQAILRFLNTHL